MVLAATRQETAISTESDTQDRLVVSERRTAFLLVVQNWPRILPLLQVLKVPDEDAAVTTSRGHKSSIRINANTADFMGSPQDTLLLTRLNIPNSHSAVASAGDEQPTIRAKAYSIDPLWLWFFFAPLRLFMAW
jgi:hypothetical protein